MNILFAAGGTGGHIIPALGVAEVLRSKGHEVIFIGVGREVEERLIEGAKFHRDVLKAMPITGSGASGFARAVLSFPIVMVNAFKLIRMRKPKIVVGFGGYPEVAPLLAAFLLGIPKALQEQNGEVGLANKVLSLICNRVFAPSGSTGFFTKKNLMTIENPVRERFLAIKPFTPVTPTLPIKLLVMGGSQGAMSLNSAVIGLVDIFRKHNIELTHQTGERDFDRVVAKYKEINYEAARVVPFIEDVPMALEEAQFVISRAGAMAVSEIRAGGRPAIFVPLEIARGHQAANAKEMVKDGAAIIVRQDANFPENLRQQLSRLLADVEVINTMAHLSKAKVEKTPATVRIAEEILRLASSN